MPNEVKPTKKNSSKLPLGHAKYNKPAEDYAPPHTMAGKRITGQEPMEHGEYAEEKAARNVTLKDPIRNGVGYGKTMETKTTGQEMRGYGAATKGKMSRGPMA